MANNQNFLRRREYQNKRKRQGDFDDCAPTMQRGQTLQQRTDANADSGEDDGSLFLSPDTEDNNPRAEADNQMPRRSQRPESAKKGRNLFGHTLGSSARNSSTITALTPSLVSDGRGQDRRVKTEQREDTSWTENILPHETVTIYVGKDNQKLSAQRSMLSKSPILEAMIVQDQIQGSYIMRPQLLAVNRSHFSTMLQFMHCQEYAPLIMTPSEGDKAKYFQHPRSDKPYSDNEYSTELVREGHLYVLAKQFNVEGFADKVQEKISEVDTTRYSLQSVLELAGVVFNNNCADHVNCDDDLEQWIIARLASSFREIMEQEQVLFWQIERQTTKQKLFAHVLDAVSETYKRLSGLPVKSNTVILD